MNVRHLNSCVNLPKYCASQGIKDLQFVRLPQFGWYAFDGQKATMAVDLIGWETAFKQLAEHPEWLDYKLTFSERANNSYLADYRRREMFERLYADSLEVSTNSEIKYHGHYIKLHDLFIEAGAPDWVQLGTGVINTALTQKYAKLGGRKVDNNRKRLLLPTWCTPNHICSLHITYVMDALPGINPSGCLEPRDRLWMDGEEGWYGQLNKKILGDFVDLGTTPGCTWDYKVDYWAKGLDLVPDMNPALIGRVWCEAPRLRHTISPDVLKRASLEDCAHLATSADIAALHKQVGGELELRITGLRAKTIHLGNYTILERDNAYYIVTNKGEQLRLTDFTVDVQQIIGAKNQSKDVLVQVHAGDAVIPMRWPWKVIAGEKLYLHRELPSCFLDHGLAVPYINIAYTRIFDLLIHHLCTGIKATPAAEPQDTSTPGA